MGNHFEPHVVGCLRAPLNLPRQAVGLRHVSSVLYRGGGWGKAPAHPLFWSPARALGLTTLALTLPVLAVPPPPCPTNISVRTVFFGDPN